MVFAYMPLLPYQEAYAEDGTNYAQQQLEAAQQEVAAKETALENAQQAKAVADEKMDGAGKAFLDEKAGDSASVDRLIEIFSTSSALSSYIGTDKFNQALSSGLTTDALFRAAALVEECNTLRAQHNLAPLQINYRLMSLAAVSAAISSGVYGHALINEIYSGTFDSLLNGVLPQFPSENLSWGYQDPFDGWYTEEKATYDKYAAMKEYAGIENMSAYEISVTEPYSNIYHEIGHYLNIVDPANTVTGFASNRYTDEQCFASDSSCGENVTPEAFNEELNAYVSGIKAEAQEAAAAVAQAQADLDAAKANLAAAQALVDERASDIASGIDHGAPWRITENGDLIIGEEGVEYTFDQWSSRPWTAYKKQIVTFSFIGQGHAAGEFTRMFEGMENLRRVDFSGVETSGVEYMSCMFMGTGSIEEVNVSGLDTSNVIKMDYMFSGCGEVKDLDVSGFDTSKVTDMSHMFEGCYSLTSLDLSGFVIGEGTKTEGMLEGCSGLKELALGNQVAFKDQQDFSQKLKRTQTLDHTPVDGPYLDSLEDYDTAYPGWYECAETACALNGHTWSDEYTVDEDATCTAEGSESQHCTVCGISNEKSARPIEKKPHEYGDWTIVQNATCQKEGEQQRKCRHCGSVQYEAIPLTDHNWSGAYEIVTAPTCTEVGAEAQFCTVCGKKKEGSERAVAALGHEAGDWEVVKAASCQEEGLRQKTCVRCGEVQETETIPLADHQWSDMYTTDREPTCDVPGLESQHCVVCGISKEGSGREIPRLAHVYGEWTETKAATCTAAGSKERKCSLCGDVETEVIPALGHNWDDGVVTTSPTCVSAGERTYTCQRCGETRTEEIPADPSNHVHQATVVTKKATPLEDGAEQVVCTDCGTVVVSEQRIPMIDEEILVDDDELMIYDGKEKTPEVIVYDLDGDVIDPSNYSVKYVNNTDAGSASDDDGPRAIVMYAGERYAGVSVLYFDIDPMEITPRIVKSSSSLTYNGKNRSPGVTVYAGDKQLTKYNATTGEGDYKVSMAKTHKNVGKWTITVTLCGNYEGSAKTTFNIIPKGTTLKKVTSTSKKTFTATWNKQTEKMSTKQITGYQLQWSTDKNFKKDTHTKMVAGVNSTSKKITSKDWSGIKSGKTYYVRIRTYTKTSSGTYYSSWSSKSLKVKTK